MLAPPRVHCLSRGGPGGHCRYPEDQVPPRTSSRSRQKARQANHTHPRVVNLSMNRTARGSSRAAACPAAPAPAAQPGAALGPPLAQRLQLPLPSSGQLRGCHVPSGSSSRCPARGSSGGHHVPSGSSSRCPARGSSEAAMCPVAPAPAAQPGAAPGPPRALQLRLPLPSPGQLQGRHVCLEGPTVCVL
jgi:hypothetical protein